MYIKLILIQSCCFFNWQWYFTLPHMLITITGKSPKKKQTKKQTHASFTFQKNSDEKPGIYFIQPYTDTSVSKIKKINKKKKKKQRKTSAISSLVRIWKTSHSYLGCCFVWKIRVVYFSVKHSYLCNKMQYQLYCIVVK